MKKKLVASLAAAMVLGVVGTSFAATTANPFTDVPAKHWAYDSVLSLEKAGIVDGYGDGTYKGDKLITRYEMAQIVAKAMAKSDKADPKQKAAIDKLATEFAAELNVIGVRVTTLENNQPTVKLNGEVDVRYNAKKYTGGGNKPDNVQERFRLEANAKVDDNTIVGFRVVNLNPTQTNPSKTGLSADNTWTKFGNDNTNQSTSVSLDRFFIQSKISTVTTATIGRQALIVGTTGTIVDIPAFSFDGARIATKVGAVNVAASYGRLPGSTDTTYNASTGVATSIDATNQKDIEILELSSKIGKLDYGVGYFQIKNDAGLVTAYSVGGLLGKDMLKLEYANAKYLFNKTFSLKAEGGQNKSAYATYDNTFYTVMATFGDQALVKAGDKNLVVSYYYVGINSLADDTSDAGLGTLGEGVTFGTGGRGIRQYNISYNYAFSKNFSNQLQYFRGMSDVNVNSYKMLRDVLIAKF